MHHRRGVTLIEVLAAIFIMGIGLLALLTLFPLGALNMARAVRDHNLANAAASAATLAEAFDVRNDATVKAQFAAWVSPQPVPKPWLASDPNGLGYAVFVDSWASDQGVTTAVGASAGLTPGLPRTGVAYGSPSASARYFTFQDDLKFADTGIPATAAVSRSMNITWAYVIRRGKSGSAAPAEISVIIFNGRVASSIPAAETNYTVSPAGKTGDTSLTLTYAAGTKVKLGRDSYLLDTTYEVLNDPVTQLPTFGTVHGYVYQVASAEDVGGNTLKVELQTPLRGNLTSVVHLEDAVFVTEKGTGWKP